MEKPSDRFSSEISRRKFLRFLANGGLALTAAPMGCSTSALENTQSRAARAIDIHHH